VFVEPFARRVCFAPWLRVAGGSDDGGELGGEAVLV
jgi:hypothetical protein